MAINAAAWLRENRAVYFDNATSVRDYRVQLRGNRSVMLFGIYLVVLIGVAMVVYNNTATVGAVEVVEAQRKLRDFYGAIIYLLGGVVTLVAPALTATAVIVERQRRSLDLIFSAPVSPKYYLVGKMMSSFRYTWMLLILALPVTATCVVLGGASWSDVLTTYVLLSVQGLILTSVALLISTISQRPVSAVIWSYGATIVYLIATLLLSIPAMARSAMSPGSTGDAPFFSLLNPFLIQYTGNTYTTIGLTHVPNWLLVVAAAGLLCKLALLAGGVQLSSRPAVEIRSLRLYGLVICAGFIYYGALSTAGSGLGSTSADTLGKDLFWILSPLFVGMPFLSTFGVDGERRFWPNGAFSVRNMLNGTPAGALPYILTLIGTCALAISFGYAKGSSTPIPMDFWVWVLYIVGFWLFFWSIGRFASSMFPGLRSARTIQFAAFILIAILPIPFFSVLAGASMDSREDHIWNLYPGRALALNGAASNTMALGWGFVMLLAGAAIGYAAELRTARKMKPVKERYEGNLDRIA